MLKVLALLAFTLAPVFAQLPGEKTHGNISYAAYQMAVPFGLPGTAGINGSPTTILFFKSTDANVSTFKVTVKYIQNGVLVSQWVVVDKAVTSYTMASFLVKVEDIRGVLIEAQKTSESAEFVS